VGKQNLLGTQSTRNREETASMRRDLTPGLPPSRPPRRKKPEPESFDVEVETALGFARHLLFSPRSDPLAELMGMDDVSWP
jgi:hypothetical protein